MLRSPTSRRPAGRKPWDDDTGDVTVAAAVAASPMMAREDAGDAVAE